MFYYISGELAMLTPNFAAVDAGGVAYKMNISANTFASLSKTGEGGKAKLFTYLAVREDAMELYGFISESELDTFTMLIGVSGVGPKAGLAILSVLSPDALATAISSGDYHSIAKANGVGPKTAQRVVLELRDKVAKQIESGAVFPGKDTGASALASTNAAGEAVNALCVLGFTRAMASAAVSKVIKPNSSVEDTIRDALKILSK